MNDMEFLNVEDLYKRIYPALSSKKREFESKGVKYIKELDIWNYLKNNKWSKASKLDLGEMVNDIFQIDLDQINIFLKEELENNRNDE